MNSEETETKINGTMGNTVKGKEAVIVPQRSREEMCYLETLILKAEVVIETTVRINSRETQTKPTKEPQGDISPP